MVDDLARNVFGIAQFKDSDSEIKFYTGFPNHQTLMAWYKFLSPGENGENIVYVTSSTDDSFTPTNSEEILGNKPVRRRKLSTLDEFFMVLIRLRHGLFELDLSHRFKFKVHVSTVNRICISRINFMYLKFGHLKVSGYPK